MDYTKELAELRKKINWQKTETDITRVEQYHREIRNELTLKREQVIQLTKELEANNTKIFTLNEQLATINSQLKESRFNFSLALKKSHLLEDELKNTKEGYVNLQMKEDMRLTELQILNSNFQKIAHENHQLSREINDLRDKLKFSTTFQMEMEDRFTEFNTIITKAKECSQNLVKEQQKIVELDKKMQSTEESQRLNQIVIEENKKLKKEVAKLENALIENTAKNKKLKHLTAKQTGVFGGEDVIAKIRFLKWEDRCKKLEQKNSGSEKVISSLADALFKEREVNAQLILQNTVYEKQIQELENGAINIKIIKDENVRIG